MFIKYHNNVCIHTCIHDQIMMIRLIGQHLWKHIMQNLNALKITIDLMYNPFVEAYKSKI